MIKRRRFKQEQPLEVRLSNEARRLRESARALRPGSMRDDAIRKARQMEEACRISEWLRSSDSASK